MYRERQYVANLWTLTMGDLTSWRGRYMVHADELCWVRAIIVEQFRYMSRADSINWKSQVRWERWKISVLSRFVPYHFQCCYNLTETARNSLLVVVPPFYDSLSVCRGSCSSKNQSSRTSPVSFWTTRRLVVYTECVLRVCAALLLAV